MGRDVELRELRIFLTLAGELHFGRTAERLGISQPAVSEAIRILESRLGVKVFDRTSRWVRLTPAGEALQGNLTPALAAVDPGLASVRNLNDPHDYASAHAQPAPEIEVRRLGPLGVDRDAQTARIPAWTLGQLADAVGLALDDRVSATLNGNPVAGQRELPLVAGDAVTFASRVSGPTRVA